MKAPTHAPLRAGHLAANTRAITAAVLAQGWRPGHGPSIASRRYSTVDVHKDALAYVSSGDGFNQSLTFEFRSEGRNILEPHGVLVPVEATPQQAAQLAAAAVKRIHDVINRSYAVRHAPVSG